jgi:hypothetical protein
MLRNLERAGEEYIKWYDRTDPEAYRAFAARVS